MYEAFFEGVGITGDVTCEKTTARDDVFIVYTKDGQGNDLKAILKNKGDHQKMVALLQQGQITHLGNLDPNTEVTIPLVKGLAWIMVSSDLVSFKTKLIYVGMPDNHRYEAPEVKGRGLFDEFIWKYLKNIE